MRGPGSIPTPFFRLEAGMRITIDVAGKTVELPKMTARLSAMSDKAQKGDGTAQGFRAVYDFLEKTVPADVLAEELDGSRFDDVDLIAMRALYARVLTAYARPVIEAQREQIEAQLSAMDGIAQTAGALGDVVRLAR